LGRVSSYLVGQIVFIPFSLGLTLLGYFSQSSNMMFPLLVLLFAVGKACSLGLIISSLGLIINRSVPKEQRASVNGLSMTVGSASKAIGPMSSAYIFAWSVSDNGFQFFPFDFHMVFIFLCIFAAMCASLPLHYVEDNSDGGDGEANISNVDEEVGESAIEVAYQSDDDVEMKSMLDVASHAQHSDRSGDRAPLMGSNAKSNK
jgi:MFS family permease